MCVCMCVQVGGWIKPTDSMQKFRFSAKLCLSPYLFTDVASNGTTSLALAHADPYSNTRREKGSDNTMYELYQGDIDS